MDIRRKQIAVYLFVALTVANFGGWCVVNFIQAAQNHAGFGIGDTQIVYDNPSGYFKYHAVSEDNR